VIDSSETLDLSPAETIAGFASTLTGLLDLLRRERAAVASLDRSELEAVVEGRSDLLRQLRRFLDRAGEPSDPVMRARFAEAVHKLVTEAAINAALLRDASDAIAAVLGAPSTDATYDAKGAMTRSARSIARLRV
jgi:hypothetical protein